MHSCLVFLCVGVWGGWRFVAEVGRHFISLLTKMLSLVIKI